MTWLYLYLGSSMGFFIASEMWVYETTDDEVERGYTMIVTVPLIALIWPIMVAVFYIAKIWRRKQSLNSTLSQ